MGALLQQNKDILSDKRQRQIRGEVTMAHSDHHAELLRRAFYKTSNNETSEDLVQTTFLKTLVYLKKGGKIDLMRSFLHHILSDLIVDEYRKHKTTSLDTLLDKGFAPRSDEYLRTADILDGRSIVLSLSLLPKKYETVIRLRYLKGLSLYEIARITGQSENTVAVQVHRGLAKLKDVHVQKTNTLNTVGSRE